METAHHINIIIHIIFGTIALLLGLGVLIMRKGGLWHTKVGQWYIKALIIVVVTGFLGIIVFKRNVFLLVVTILSGYTAWSGIRTLHLKGSKPTLIDHLVPVASLIVTGGYIYYLQRAKLFWSPVVTYTLLGALLLVCTYDIVRSMFTYSTRKNLWLYEHIYKMTSSFIAILSAFTGTVLGNYKPYSQFIPGVFGWIYIIGAIMYFSRRKIKVTLVN